MRAACKALGGLGGPGREEGLQENKPMKSVRWLGLQGLGLGGGCRRLGPRKPRRRGSWEGEEVDFKKKLVSPTAPLILIMV